VDATNFPLIDLSGSPYERGVMLGKAVPERVLRSVNLYRGELERRGVKLPQIEQLARDFTPHVTAFDPAYLEEMQGIADGAELKLEDIILVNCRTEMMFGARIMIDDAMLDKNDGCTAVIVLPGASATGELIHAHNWDWREECVDTGVVLRIRRNDGPDILTFVEAGGLARHGLNANGVSITGNFLGCDRDYKTGGRTPLALVRRKLLESANLAAALRTAWSGQRACSANVMLAAAEGEAINLEMAPDEIFWIQPQDGILVHANHWVSPAAQAKLRDTGIAITVDTLYRQRRTEAAMRRQNGRISIAAVKEALADEYGKPDSVLRPPKPAIFSAISATVCTTVMLPGKGEMSVARKPWIARNFHKYSLS
jgi:isopenicillin-N N-acyltransferase-like protein